MAEGGDETLQRLWTGGRAGSRGPKPALDLDRIVDAAIAIADTDGLDAVSMARVGEALGCSAMALYRHVSGKAQLLSLMVDAVAGQLALPPRRGEWREDLAAWTRAQIDGMASPGHAGHSGDSSRASAARSSTRSTRPTRPAPTNHASFRPEAFQRRLRVMAVAFIRVIRGVISVLGQSLRPVRGRRSPGR